jgi:hypothetical protein
MCVDLTIFPSGRLIMRGCVAGRTFDMGVLFMTKMEVAPVSTTACVWGILGVRGSMPGAHTSCSLDLFDVASVILSLMTVFRVGYKVGV